MLHDQIMTVLATLVPLLLINSVGLIRESYVTALSIASGVARRVRRRDDLRRRG